MLAILPAAGKGTRMREIGEGSKEFLEVGGRPILLRVIDEASNAGLDQHVIVVSPTKPDLVAAASSIPTAKTVMQDAPTGLAPAVAQAAGCQPVVILLPDTLFHPESPTKRLVDALNRGFDIAIAIERVAEDRVSRYGIVEWNEESGRIGRIVEKPRPDETPSRWAIAGRLALSARTMFFVKERVASVSGMGGEIDLPPILGEAIAAGHCGLAVPLEGNEVRLDCGNPEGYRRAIEVFREGV